MYELRFWIYDLIANILKGKRNILYKLKIAKGKTKVLG